MKIALYYRHIDDTDRPAFESLLSVLEARNIEAVTVRDGDSVDGCDYLFSIGGDGTLLSSVQFVHSSNPQSFPPIVGINFGHLGFLTTVGKENLAAMVDDLLEGRFTLEQRTLLQISSPHPAVGNSFALNEVFLHRPEESSLLRTEVYVDGDYVATVSSWPHPPAPLPIRSAAAAPYLPPTAEAWSSLPSGRTPSRCVPSSYPTAHTCAWSPYPPPTTTATSTVTTSSPSAWTHAA